MNLRCLFVFFLLILSVSVIGYSQVSEKDTAEIKKHILFLCNDSLAGRSAGSEGEMIAFQYVEDIFFGFNLNYFFKDGFAESFIFIDDFGDVRVSRNVAALISHGADSTILLMAHIDHLGMGGVHSKSYTNSQIHYGADDNASGVASILYLAKVLKNKEFAKYNYILLITGAREPGYFGSGSFVRKYGKRLSDVKLVINLDMVGRMKPDEQLMYACFNEASKSMFDYIRFHLSVMTYKVSMGELHEGDHTPFDSAGFKVLLITTGQHHDYHKVSDTPEKLNYQGMLNVVNFIIEILKL